MKKKKSKYHQGKFTPKNPDKYMGDVNNIIYRSGWELRYMRFLDSSSSIKKWCSEPFYIPYISEVDDCKHRYFPDFLVYTREGHGYIVEVKPLRETKPPRKTSRKDTYLEERKRRYRETKRWVTWRTNKSKWGAAEAFCQRNGLQFKLVTEKSLGIDGKTYKKKKRL